MYLISPNPSVRSYVGPWWRWWRRERPVICMPDKTLLCHPLTVPSLAATLRAAKLEYRVKPTSVNRTTP